MSDEFNICESCRRPVDVNDPNVVRLQEWRDVPTMKGDPPDQMPVGVPSAFHRGCAPATGRKWRPAVD